MELRNNDNEVVEETICAYDVVRFGLDDRRERERAGVPGGRAAGIRSGRGCPVVFRLKGYSDDPYSSRLVPAVQGPDLSTLAGVTAYRTKLTERHSKLAQDVAVLKRTAAAAGGQVPEAAQRETY